METFIQYAEPAAQAVWEYTVLVIQYMVETTSPLRAWIQENVPVYGERILSRLTPVKEIC